ncbi:prephenate dehydratase [Rossellomorea aquimaris]|uniref:Prephenate dehydratase n=1 Tax=Rossellomorea aquimaris TaxID=189382 RepID=A0A1J6WR61_9BACI|nr:prephenate dehydratase [Rossellomorea aquimaris]OIU70715.1 prephenate dehydratase [Rossellomorea aquimaris]
MKIAYLGPQASFTDLAVRKAFPDEHQVPCVTIPDCIEAVIEDEVDYAVVPLENALEGSVHITVDYLFHEADLSIVAELTSPIQQHLMVHPENSGNEPGIDKIMSHSHALAQCHKFLHKEYRGVPLEQTTSTAAAAKYVSEHPGEKIAAIGNELAAKEYGLSIIHENIHDFAYNHTRFIVLNKKSQPLSIEQKISEDKTTLMVTLPKDRSGALHQVLSTFAWRQLNLSKIESRPLKTGLGDYFFLIDVAHGMDEVLLPGAISEMEALGCEVKMIGTYSSYLLGE